MSEEQQQALKAIANYLSRRLHSEKELSIKLSKKFSADAIEQALEQARQNKWLEEPGELAERVVNSLQEKNKSWRYIQSYLREKDLPLPAYDHERELEKAKKLLLKKTGSLENLSFEEKLKLRQFLSYRGFEKSLVDDLLDEGR